MLVLLPEDGSQLLKHVGEGTVLLYIGYILYVQIAGFMIYHSACKVQYHNIHQKKNKMKNTKKTNTKQFPSHEQVTAKAATSGTG